MFSVLFEVHPKSDQWEAYLANAKMLRPELEKIDGFVDNIRYRSLTRDGWILSLSGWRDEKSLVRWRTHAGHHGVQELGRGEILSDYHLRVGQIIADTQVPPGHELVEQRLDLTDIGLATFISLIDARQTPEWIASHSAQEVAESLGLDTDFIGLVGWDVFDAVLAPGNLILMTSWEDQGTAEAFDIAKKIPEGARFRTVRVVRDYGMYDRRETPQYYPEKARPKS